MLPTPILFRLQDLRLWQGNYDNFCKKNVAVNSSTHETLDTAVGLSESNISTNSPEEQAEWDQIVISPTKTFEQLLEEKLAEENVPEYIDPKPKRPFLRKGSGLARYQLSNSKKRQLGKSDRNRKNVGEKTKKKVTLTTCEAIQTKIECDEKRTVQVLSPLKMPDIGIRTKATWSKVIQEKSPASNCNESTNTNNKNGHKPLVYFEDNLLNCKPNIFNSQVIDKINEFAAKQYNSRRSLIFPNIDQKFYTYSPESPKVTREQPLYEHATDKELRIFEELERRADNSSFCSTNSSIVKMLSSSTPHKILSPSKYTTISEENYNSEREINSTIENGKCLDLQQKLQEVSEKTEVINNFLHKLKKFNEDNEKLGSCNDSDVKTLNQLYTNDFLSFSDDDHWTTNSESVKSTSTSNLSVDQDPFQDATCINDKNKTDVGVNTSFGDVSEVVKCEKCETLRDQIVEGEKKISNLEADKNKTSRLCKELEKKLEELERDMNKMQKKYDDEIVCLKDELLEERKKLLKEKMVFETYIKDAQNRPTKKEREEISNLRKELADLKETLKLKETKNGSAQARLRNQIKHLTNESSQLKEEVEKLTKENAKLTAKQKVNYRPSETKMLHEINKNLTKLTQETLQKQLTKPKENKRSGSSRSVMELKPKSKQTIRMNSSNSVGKCDSDVGDSDNEGQLNKDVSNNDITKFANVSLEKRYENVFGGFKSPKNDCNLNDSKKEKSEVILEDGTKEIRYSNGNVKTISPDENLIIVKYFNGDIKQTNLKDKTLKYYYASNCTWHTEFPDGSELIEFPNGQNEKKFSDGRVQVWYPDGVVQMVMPDGTEETKYPDGSVLEITLKGEKILYLPNGQKEIHTKDQKRREYPDGTIKILYPDGTQETRYANGRVRMKDGKGLLIMDTHQTILS